MVVGVPDEEFGQRVGAVLVLREEQGVYKAGPGDSSSGARDTRRDFTIYDLRKDLRDKLAGYKMPTLLRVVEGELPKSATGKVVKKVLGPQYFPADYTKDRQVQVWRREAKI